MRAPAAAAALLTILIPLPALGQSPRAERYPDGWCGSGPDTARIVLENHRRRMEEIAARTGPGGVPESVDIVAFGHCFPPTKVDRLDGQSSRSAR